MRRVVLLILAALCLTAWAACTVRKPYPQGKLSDAAVIVDETVQDTSPFDLPLRV